MLVLVPVKKNFGPGPVPVPAKNIFNPDLGQKNDDEGNENISNQNEYEYDDLL